MLKTRLVACLLWRNGMLIQSRNFTHTNSVGNAYTAIDFFNTWAIDEIVLLDVTRDSNDREKFHRDLRELSSRCFVPLAVGGWVSSLEEIRILLAEGADKVVVNTAAYKDESLLQDASRRFGKQCIVLSMDVKRNEDREYEVFIDRGREATGMHPVKWAKKAESLGAGEIFLTSIDHDGLLKGYDTDIISQVSNAVNIPVIASGGVGEWQHLSSGIEAGATAVSAANIFHYLEHSTKKAKDYLFEQGINVRRPEFYDILLPRRPVYRV
jgi:cyclase